MKDLLSKLTTFRNIAMGRLLLLALAAIALWQLAAPEGLSTDERQLWERVNAAQQHIDQWRSAEGSITDAQSDSWNCGLIGLEWSDTSTTLGDLSSKRTACNPAWAVQFSRWFKEQGLAKGDRVAIYSSASFPGLLLSAMAASEALELQVFLVVSLGASTWGANDPAYPWPVLAAELRRAGFIQKRADFYTLGGGAELGQSLSPEGLEILRSAAKDAGVEVLSAASLEAMIQLKSDLLKQQRSRLLLSIGGSHANMGDDYERLGLPTGPVPLSDINIAGNGVIGNALRADIPVIHMLNLRYLSRQTGIPYDSKPRQMAPGRISAWWSAAGNFVFFLVVARHRRGQIEDSPRPNH